MKILIVDDVNGWIEYHTQRMEELFPNAEIITASSAAEGYDKLLENTKSPFDIILTDLQMELAYEPQMAGEWFVEQIQKFKEYSKTKVVIISASYNISFIAEKYGVDTIRKPTAIKFPDAYNFLKE